MSQPPKPISEMTDQEYLEWVTVFQMGGWVPLKQYLKMYPTETRIGIMQRVKHGVWVRGTHYSVPSRGSGAWVNLPAIRAWVESDVGSLETPDLGS